LAHAVQLRILESIGQESESGSCSSSSSSSEKWLRKL